MFKYSINLAWSDENDCYLATIPEFPGLMTHGDTPEEAVVEAEVAAQGFLEIYEEDGDPIPEPIKVKEYSGSLRIRIPKSLHKKLAVEAYREGVSLNTYMIHLLSTQNAIIQTAKEMTKEVHQALSDKMIYVAPHQNTIVNSVNFVESDPYCAAAFEQKSSWGGNA